MTRTAAEIRAKFAQLRITTEPRGHDLLDALERAWLFDNAILAHHERLQTLEAQLSAPLTSGQLASPAAPDAGAENVLAFPGHSVRA